MKIENHEHFIKLIADENMRLTNKDRTIFVEYLYLGKGDDSDNYEEVGKEVWLPLAKDKTTDEKFDLVDKKMDDINDQQEFQDMAIDSTMVALMETFDMVLFLLEDAGIMRSGERSVMSIGEEHSPMSASTMRGGVPKMVDFYVVAIQRGLKTIEDVPKMYRAQVQAMLEALA